MKIKTLISFLMLILFWYSGWETGITKAEETETGAKAHSVVRMVFLAEGEKANNSLTRLEPLLDNSHTIIFTLENQEDKAVQDIIREYNINEFPAVVVDGKVFTFIKEWSDKEGRSLEEVCEETAKRETITISPHLAVDIVDQKTLVTMFYICCYNENESIENGRVMVYLVENDKYRKNGFFRALLADNKSYYVEPGSCHAPETVYWEIPDGIDPKNLRVVMVVYDDGKILGTCCSAPECTERAEE